MHYTRDVFPVSDVGGVVSTRVGCEEGCVGNGLVSAVADVGGCGLHRRAARAFNVAEVMQETFEGVLMPLGAGFGGYRQAVDDELHVCPGGVGDIAQVSEYLLELFRLGVFRKRLVLVCVAMKTNPILILCGLAVGNVNFCFSQDVGHVGGLGDVQRTVGSALYGPAEQGAWLPEAFDFVRG